MTTSTEIAGAFMEALVETAVLDTAGGDVGDAEAAIEHAARAAHDADETPALRCADRLARIALRALRPDPGHASDALRRAHRVVVAS